MTTLLREMGLAARGLAKRPGYATVAALTLALGIGATLAIFTVVSFIVSQRTAEIGVRMALGAQPADIRAMVLRQGLLVVLAGLGVGLVAAAGVAGMLRSLLFGVSARDPLTFTGVAAALLAVSVAAIYLPARRAAAVDPVRAFREEL